MSQPEFFQNQPAMIGALKGHQCAGSECEVCCEQGAIRVRFLGGMTRVRFSRTKFAENPLSYVIPKERPRLPFSLEEGDSVVLKSAEAQVRINRTDSALTILSADGREIFTDLRFGWEDDRATVSARVGSEVRFHGTGLRSRPFNLRGRSFRMWNQNTPNARYTRDSSYSTVPFVLLQQPTLSRGIFFDNPALAELDCCERTPDVLSFQICDRELDLYLISGPTPQLVLERYTELTGRIELPPLWVAHFGYSRYGMLTVEQVRQRVRRCAERGIPLSYIIGDLDYMTDNQPWTWDRDRYADPKELADWLGDRDLRSVFIMDPLIPIRPGYAPYDEMLAQGLFCQNGSGDSLAIFEGFAGPSHLPDLANPKTMEYLTNRFGLATQEFHSVGWWLDKNEPAKKRPPEVQTSGSTAENRSAEMGDVDTVGPNEARHLGGISEAQFHNMFALRFAEAAHQGQRAVEPNRRPFVLSRSMTAGSQRYAFTWNGDLASDWGSLANSIIQLKQLGMSGIPCAGTDIGGFFGDCPAELMSRWIQFGVFSPLARIHSFIGCFEHAPWHLGDRCREIVRKYVELRSRLVPVTNDLFWRAMETGTPLMEPLFYRYPNDPVNEEAWTDYQYFWGPFLVAPVCDAGHSGKNVFLPGVGQTYYDFWTRREYSGGRSHHVAAPEETLPLFVQAGAIVPMGPVLPHVDDKVRDVVVNVYTGAAGSYLMHLCDGCTMAYTQGGSSTVRFDYEGTRERGQFRIGKRAGGYNPSRRDVTVRFLVVNCPTKMSIDGRALDRHDWFYHQPNEGSVSVAMIDDGDEHVISYE